MPPPLTAPGQGCPGLGQEFFGAGRGDWAGQLGPNLEILVEMGLPVRLDPTPPSLYPFRRFRTYFMLVFEGVEISEQTRQFRLSALYLDWKV